MLSPRIARTRQRTVPIHLQRLVERVELALVEDVRRARCRSCRDVDRARPGTHCRALDRRPAQHAGIARQRRRRRGGVTSKPNVALHGVVPSAGSRAPARRASRGAGDPRQRQRRRLDRVVSCGRCTGCRCRGTCCSSRAGTGSRARREPGSTRTTASARSSSLAGSSARSRNACSPVGAPTPAAACVRVSDEDGDGEEGCEAGDTHRHPSFSAFAAPQLSLKRGMPAAFRPRERAHRRRDGPRAAPRREDRPLPRRRAARARASRASRTDT